MVSMMARSNLPKEKSVIVVHLIKRLKEINYHLLQRMQKKKPVKVHIQDLKKQLILIIKELPYYN